MKISKNLCKIYVTALMLALFLFFAFWKRFHVETMLKFYGQPPKDHSEQDSSYLVAFTFSSSWRPEMCRVIKTAIAQDINIVLLGLNHVHDKRQKTLAFLEAASLWPNPNDIGLFFDAYDVLFQRDDATLIDVFKSFKSDIVIGAEKNCWPPQLPPRYCHFQTGDPLIEKLYPEGSRPVRYINTGVVMAKMWAARSWYYDNMVLMSKYDIPGDQAYAAINYSEMKNKKYTVKLDLESKLVQNMHWSVNDIELDRETGAFRNKYTGSYPGMIHFNGDKRPLQKFEYALDIDSNKFDEGAGFYFPNGSYVLFKDMCP